MTHLLRATSAVALVALLSACGGDGTTPPTTPPSTSTAPASTSTSDLIAFALDGGTATTLASGVNRRVRNFEDGGTNGRVVVDRLDGTDFGLVQYHLGDDVFIYRVTGEPVTAMTLPSGNYNGPLNVNYRFDSGAAWATMAGDVTMTLNFATGDLSIGGMASNANHSIELFGDATLAGNQFSDNNTTIRLRDAAAGGVFIRDETGQVQGIAVSHEDTQALFGLLSGSNGGNGFLVEGGFTATYSD